MYWTFINQRIFQQCFVKNLVEQAFEQHGYTFHQIRVNCREHKGDSEKERLNIAGDLLQNILDGKTYKTFASFFWKDVCLHNGLNFRDIMLMATSDYVISIKDLVYRADPNKVKQKPSPKIIPISEKLLPKKRGRKKKSIEASEHPLKKNV